jgi:hypothetical protein
MLSPASTRGAAAINAASVAQGSQLPRRLSKDFLTGSTGMAAKTTPRMNFALPERYQSRDESPQEINAKT